VVVDAAVVQTWGGSPSGNRGDENGVPIEEPPVSLRTRIARVTSRLTAVTPDCSIWSITLIRACHDPDGRRPGMYGASLHLDIVYEGEEPPPLPRERMASHCLVIECHPEPIPPPTTEAGDFSEISTKCDTLPTPITKGSL
jgi:hypothetical protein